MKPFIVYHICDQFLSILLHCALISWLHEERLKGEVGEVKDNHRRQKLQFKARREQKEGGINRIKS